MNIIKKKPICIHKYLTKPHIIKNIIGQPPSGLGDFLRGTVALFKLSEIYNYDVFIDKKSHPFFSFFEYDINYINDNSIDDDIFDLWNYETYKLEELFKKQDNFLVHTNCFYTKNENGEYVNFGKIPENIQNKIKNLLIPKKIVNDKLEYIFKNIYKLKDYEKFKTIHIRLGDNYLLNNKKSNDYDYLLKNILEHISFIIYNDNRYKYILLTDSKILSNDIIKFIPEILYWDNEKIHMGYSDNQNQENILDTIIDFITLTKSEEIIGNDSGFSRSVSEIYNIKYNHIFDISYFN